MPRHCVSVRLEDGSTVSLQFGKVPTEAEIKTETESMERMVDEIKNKKGTFFVHGRPVDNINTGAKVRKDEYP